MPRRLTARKAQGRVVALALAGVMALSLAAYYFNAAAPRPAPAGTPARSATGDRYVEQGNQAYDGGDYAAAIRYYEKALPWRGQDPAVLTDLGTAYFYRTPSDPDRAIAYYDQALAASPGFPNALLNKGIVLLQGKHDPAGAITAWKQLLAVLPKGDPMIDRVQTFIANAETLLKAKPDASSAKPVLPTPGAGSKLSSGFGR